MGRLEGRAAVITGAAGGIGWATTRRFVEPTFVARLWAYAGDGERTLEWLEKAFERRAPNLPYVAVNPAFDFLRDDKSAGKLTETRLHLRVQEKEQVILLGLPRDF